MASAAPPITGSPLSADRAWHYVRLGFGLILSAALGGLLSAGFTYLFTEKQNHEAVVQQQYLAAVQDFVGSGARVDAAVTGLSDSLIDAQGVRDGRREARQAIAAHVAATQGLSQVIGKGNSDAYMEGLATLRTMVDDAKDVKTALTASNARFDLMENRTIIVAEARRRIYGES